jgi:hypothetical protein
LWFKLQLENLLAQTLQLTLDFLVKLESCLQEQKRLGKEGIRPVISHLI